MFEQKASMHPAAVVAVGVVAVLLVLFAVIKFRGSGREETDTASAPSASHPRGALKHAPTQRAHLEGDGWVAVEAKDGTMDGRGSAPPRRGSAARADAAAETAGAATGPASTAQQGGRSNAAADATGGRETDALAKTDAGASTAPGAAAGSVAPGAAGIQGASGGAPRSANNLNNATQQQPGANQPTRQPAEQGTTLFDSVDNPACKGATCAPLPADSQTAINVGPGQSVITGKSGTVSFWLEPQWEATDNSNATLVQLGRSNTSANRFEIYKNGQSLGFNFTGNSGVPIDISAAIDSWQPGEQHLITSTWSETQNGQGEVSFFIDGKLVGQQPYDGPLEFAPNMPLTIGSNYGDGATAPGTFGPFRLYKNPLSPDQVAAQVAAGAPKK